MQGDPEGRCRIVLGGISACERPDKWWASQVGPGRVIDPAAGAVLGLEYIGPTPNGWKGVSTFDQAAGVEAVLDVLGIERVDAFVGASYGGCVGLAFAVRYPTRVGHVLAISASHRPAPMTTALRSIQRDLIRKGMQEDSLAGAVALARSVAMTTYRTEDEFAERFDEEPRWSHGRWRFPVADYLASRGRAFAGSFDAARYLSLSESLDLHRIDPEAVNVPLHLLAVKEDRLIPERDICELAEATGASLEVISSRYGHDAFLKEEDAVARWLRTHLGEDRHSEVRMRSPREMALSMAPLLPAQECPRGTRVAPA